METTKEVKSKRTKNIDYRGLALQGAGVIAQGALFAIGSNLVGRLVAPRVKAKPELTVIGGKEEPLATRKVAGQA